jgi:hypothetical protein
MLYYTRKEKEGLSDMTQMFRKIVPRELLFQLLDKICLKTGKYYLFDMNAYRKLMFYNLCTDFCESLKEYYHLGKHTYLNRTITYNAFTTIIRQICKGSDILFSTKIKYNESKYNIDCFIFF